MDKYDVLKVTVGKSHTPYHTDRNIAYIRSHAISQVMSKTEYKKRLLQYDQPTFDFSALPIEQATMEDIDPNAMNVLKSKLNNPRANFQITDDNEQLLKNLHLIQN
jgi:predicted HTH transcriptional regulator